MGGKRPDQHNIAPGEAGASDYKNLPQVAKGHGSLEDTVTQDKQKVAEGKGVGSGGGSGQHFFDPKHPQPSQHAGAGHAAGGGQGGTDDDERRRELEGTEDPRERGVGA